MLHENAPYNKDAGFSFASSEPSNQHLFLGGYLVMEIISTQNGRQRICTEETAYRNNRAFGKEQETGGSVTI
jgi:hypothetical protein